MTETSDQYVYPGTHVLSNLRDIRDSEQLAQLEARSTSRRILELAESPLKGKFDTFHLKSIHAYIFRDIFHWAGQFRVVNISKGGHSFARADFIEPSLNGLFGQLAAESQLRGLGREAFISRAAFFLAEINAIHPFREGNGRSQREFVRQLAAQAGFTLDWRGILQSEMTTASKESFLTRNISGFIRIIDRCCVRRPPPKR